LSHVVKISHNSYQDYHGKNLYETSSQSLILEPHDFVDKITGFDFFHT